MVKLFLSRHLGPKAALSLGYSLLQRPWIFNDSQASRIGLLCAHFGGVFFPQIVILSTT